MCIRDSYKIPLPLKCDECGEKDSLHPCGPGVERTLEEVQQFFPDASSAILSSDMVNTPKELADTINKIEKAEIDIIIGTQVLAKGHNFPSLALVGVIDADIGLEGGDLRASEKTYQLLHQVAGRAGRTGKHKGTVLLQTYNPNSRLMKELANGSRDSFVNTEIQGREDFELPPFTNMALITFSSNRLPELTKILHSVAIKAPQVTGVNIMGPCDAAIYLLLSLIHI